jgi:hypothetical protein
MLERIAINIPSRILPYYLVTKKMKCCEYESISLQDVILFLISEWAQDTRVSLQYLVKVCQGHTVLLIGPLSCYQENEVL